MDNKTTRELSELLHREADLLLRGTKVENLAGLRRRIRALFVQFCEDPLVNPEAKNVLEVGDIRDFR